MKPKFKAFLFNFIGFAVLFVIIRTIMWFLLSSDSIFLAIVAAVLASVLSPKFAVSRTKEGEKLFMKWVFIKGLKEI
ncbi:hypothetical protein SB49_01660 [Sediminicola sp. YIK13]|uniref:hypothetical protein n=1 Tax=Sediminicola sp. YIK13 TaxID=1453352 RepID=UPI000722FEDA|nr:hypothetical protein [Sediminicola sp. YIK13]ALM06652.1 hypothetical protein SB49_01660 [Sediminicola sp. YIK13]